MKPVETPLSIARQVVATTCVTNPDDIARIVLDRTPDAQIRDSYLMSLRGVAREAIRLENMQASRPVPNNSRRVGLIRESHTTYFDQRVCPNGEWKLLGECTIADVESLAAERRMIAAKNIAKAEEFDALADRMRAAGAQTARELEGVAA